MRNEVYILRHIMSGSSIKHGRVKIDPFFLIWLYLPYKARLGMMNRFRLLYYVQPSYALKYEIY